MNADILRDLFVVVADLDMENVIKTLLCSRKAALGIGLEFDPDRDLLRYIKRDSGCCRDAETLLRPPMRSHRHAMILFDRHGSGVDNTARESIENEVERKLSQCGWAQDSVAAIVIDPELENWVWSDSPHVANALGWRGNFEELRTFLINKQLWISGAAKPVDPKGALDRSLRERSRKGGARLFAELAGTVGIHRCIDPSFVKFRSTLQRWFSVP